MLTRRGFVKRLAGGIAGTIVAAHLPAELIDCTPEWLKHQTSLAYLTKVWNAFAKGDGHKHMGSFDLHVGWSLFEQIDQELARVSLDLKRISYGGIDEKSEKPWVVFKTTRVIPSGQGGWGHEFVNRDQRAALID